MRRNDAPAGPSSPAGALCVLLLERPTVVADDGVGAFAADEHSAGVDASGVVVAAPAEEPASDTEHRIGPVATNEHVALVKDGDVAACDGVAPCAATEQVRAGGFGAVEVVVACGADHHVVLGRVDTGLRDALVTQGRRHCR